MATADAFVAAPPEQVWAVLSDARSYAHWVVGSKEVRDADSDWPQPGTRFHHTVGWGPLTVRDHTTSLRAEEPWLLEMKAKARPVGTATVRFELRPEGNGTRITMTEGAGDAASVLLFNPFADLAVRRRNVESLRRLGELAERRRVPAAA